MDRSEVLFKQTTHFLELKTMFSGYELQDRLDVAIFELGDLGIVWKNLTILEEHFINII